VTIETLTDIARLVTNGVIAVLLVVAVWVTWLNRRETRYLERDVKPLIRDDEDLPLFDVLLSRARNVTRIGWWLILLTALGAAGITVADYFPPLRAINAALLLYLIAGPRIIGMALRRQRSDR
jgi:hypothetical protein